MPGSSPQGEDGRRWPWFAAWIVPGACFGMFVSVVGLVTIPAGAVIAVVLRRRSAGRERLGLLVGVGITTTFIGSLHGGYRACSGVRQVLVLRPGQASTAFSCGGVDGSHWLIAGVALIIAASATYWYLARRAMAGGARRNPPLPA